MKKYAKLDKEGGVEKFPYSLSDLKREHPLVSLPANPADEALAEFGVIPIETAPRPDFQPYQRVRPKQSLDNRNDIWFHDWEVVDLEEDEIQDRAKDRMWRKLAQVKEITLNNYPTPIQVSLDPETIAILNNKAIMVLVDQTLGNTTATYSFRDAAGVIHEFEPGIMLRFFRRVCKYVERVQTKSWRIVKEDLAKDDPFEGEDV